MSSDLPNGLPTLPLEWRWQSFNELCYRISVGHVGETNSFFCGAEGIPFLRSQNVRPGRLELDDIRYVTNDFHRKSKKSQLDAGDILIVRVGQNRGDCAVVPEDLGELNCANIVLAKPNKKYSNYLGYFFNSPLGREALLALSSGSAQLVLNTKAIATVMVPVPPESVAIEIGLILKSLDDRIALLRESNATLEAIAQALFKSWFVDFDPVHAKQQGIAPEGLDEATAALFPDGFEESDLGLVPKGWKVERLETIMELSYGKALKATERIVGEVPVYGSGGITGYHNKSLVNGPSIVIGRKGTVGSLYWEDQPFFPIDTVFYVQSDMPMTYCFYLLQTLGLTDMNTDAAVPGLNRNNVYRLKIPKAPEAVLLAFDNVVDVLRGSIFKNNQQAQTLASLRDTLLPRLISGQLRLPEAEPQIVEALA